MIRLSAFAKVRTVVLVTTIAMLAVAAGPAAAQSTPTRGDLDNLVGGDGSAVPVPGSVSSRDLGSGRVNSVISQPSFAGTGIPTGFDEKAIDGSTFGTQSIIPPDERYRISPTTTFPYRAIALITLDSTRCTGWFFGPDVLWTAGHCVHTGGSGGSWRTNVRVYPGYNGSAGAPYGSCTAKQLYASFGWTYYANHEYDYGIVKLNCTLGYTVGWFGYWSQSASLDGEVTRVCGYPGDKPLELWCGDHDNGAIARVVSSTAEKVYYRNDTVGGVSGAPVFQYRPGCGWCGMAIHGYGGDPNSGKRITSAILTWLDPHPLP